MGPETCARWPPVMQPHAANHKKSECKRVEATSQVPGRGTATQRLCRCLELVTPSQSGLTTMTVSDRASVRATDLDPALAHATEPDGGLSYLNAAASAAQPEAGWAAGPRPGPGRGVPGVTRDRHGHGAIR